MIKCTSCGYEYSENAVACPKCGNPNQNKNNKEYHMEMNDKLYEAKKYWRKKLLFSLIIVIAFCVSWYLVPKIVDFEGVVSKQNLDGVTALSVRAIMAPSFAFMFISFIYGFFFGGHLNPFVGGAMGLLFSLIIILVIIMPISYIVPERHWNTVAFILAFTISIYVFISPVYYLYQYLRCIKLSKC